MITRLLIQTFALVVMMGALLFLAAGDWQWPQAWLFLGEFLISGLAVGIWLARHDPALLAERMTALVRRDQMRWDRIFMSVVIIAFFAWLGLIALDARRFVWSHVPLSAQVLGAPLIALSMVMCWRTFRVNSFAVPQARIQAERAQHVVSEGPYRFVRHPMYSGAILLFIGVPLMLGSFCGLALAPVFIFALALRAIGEENMLLRDLAGYDEYARKVRFRFVPGLW